MVNLWLGSRLLLDGTLQVAELYTLLGTVKEARVYQLELLRIAQRFHNPSWYAHFYLNSIFVFSIYPTNVIRLNLKCTISNLHDGLYRPYFSTQMGV